MNLEILNTLLEANSEMPTKESILRRFRGDFAARLAARLDGSAAPLPEPDYDASLTPTRGLGAPAALGFKTIEEPPAPEPEEPLAATRNVWEEAPAQELAAPAPEASETEQVSNLFAAARAEAELPFPMPSEEPSHEATAERALESLAQETPEPQGDSLASLFSEAVKEESAQLADAASALPTESTVDLSGGAPESPVEEGRKGKKKKKKR